MWSDDSVVADGEIVVYTATGGVQRDPDGEEERI